ncbi:MAG: ADP-forming succinate--CoA ligase subunit beta [Methylococcaceae bacterium]|nr:ADP-forming succinate--CoA ligase subunit beta [Methylococcaceae bacterium]MCI0667994.1 ADP-forming succinate--CoA ligase subunit beta [Methylococcaceae bacterium]MCI0732873.1 ADP-forming succinate--CoA ligase subunit beta [Methylococcaceae bacterium]
MNLHEFQAKHLFASYGIPVPVGVSARTADEAMKIAQTLGGSHWVVKAQVHAGGRGKAGGVKIVNSIEQVGTVAASMLGHRLTTRQSGSKGLPIDIILIEQVNTIKSEMYLSAVVDRSSERILFLASASGGIDIEEVAAANPEKILTVRVHPAAGLQAYQSRQLAFGLGLKGKQIGQINDLMQKIYRLFLEKDASQIEINPLVITSKGDLLALDAKINIDDNALYLHFDISEMRDPAQEDEKEAIARRFDLNYITLNGSIGCMVNGAGLAMATMDLVKLKGGEPANFLDVGGGTDAKKVAEAFKLILSDTAVRAVLVNIFGGIVRCDVIAEGILAGIREVGVEVPVVVRLEGTNAKEGLALLKDAGLDIITAEDLEEAAAKAVAAAAA